MNLYEFADHPMGRSSNRQCIGSMASTNPDRIQISQVGLYRCDMQPLTRWYTTHMSHYIHTPHMHMHTYTNICAYIHIYVYTCLNANTHAYSLKHPCTQSPCTCNKYTLYIIYLYNHANTHYTCMHSLTQHTNIYSHAHTLHTPTQNQRPTHTTTHK